MNNTVADWRAYRANVRTRHGLTSTATAATTTTTTISADAAPPTPTPTTTPSSPSPPPSVTTTTNGETEQWRLKYLALQEQLAQTTETQQHSVRDQVQRELALARQKSAVLGEQVQSLELCAVELAERTIERDMLATNLTRAMGRVEELEAINKDLLQANTHMSGGLDAAMASAQEERNLLRKRQERERQAIEEAEKSAADAGALATSAQETIDDCTRQVEDSARARAALEIEMAALKDQLAMERHVASDKVQEMASKLQVALTSRDENTHTYQLALQESEERVRTMEAEVKVLRNVPTETEKLKRKLKKARRRLQAYEKDLARDTENLRRQTNVGLASVTEGTGIHVGRSVRSNVGSSDGIRNSNVLTLHSLAGKELMFHHALEVAKIQ